MENILHLATTWQWSKGCIGEASDVTPVVQQLDDSGCGFVFLAHSIVRLSHPHKKLCLFFLRITGACSASALIRVIVRPLMPTSSATVRHTVYYFNSWRWRCLSAAYSLQTTCLGCFDSVWFAYRFQTTGLPSVTLVHPFLVKRNGAFPAVHGVGCHGPCLLRRIGLQKMFCQKWKKNSSKLHMNFFSYITYHWCISFRINKGSSVWTQ